MIPKDTNDRRIFSRHFLSAAFQMKGHNAKNEPVDVQIEILDISYEGMGFVSDVDFDKGDILNVTLIRKNHSSPVTLQILWKDSETKRYGARFMPELSDLNTYIK